jgi:hypothetical protein
MMDLLDNVKDVISNSNQLLEKVEQIYLLEKGEAKRIIVLASPFFKGGYI